MATRSSLTSRRKTALTWLGHSAFKIVSPNGKTLLIDPWLDNPKAPPGANDIAEAHLILVTHGHSDHLGSTIELAKRTGARAVAIYEVCSYLQSRGIATAQGMNKGGTISVDGINVTMVDAKHSADISEDGRVLPGGEAAGFVIQLENGLKMYHAGDTALFLDMKLIAQLYKPEVVFLPIGGLYTMGPKEAALACAWLHPKHIIGMHYGTFPALSGTPEELRKHLPPALKKRVIELQPGITAAV
jgi:L-ascorbate metabolism protein UlaG (beta-lactamase superfamily)